jgi:hypothetical protein
VVAVKSPWAIADDPRITERPEGDPSTGKPPVSPLIYVNGHIYEAEPGDAWCFDCGCPIHFAQDEPCPVK